MNAPQQPSGPAAPQDDTQVGSAGLRRGPSNQLASGLTGDNGRTSPPPYPDGRPFTEVDGRPALSSVNKRSAPPPRPYDTWRVCNRTLDEGCKCKPFLTPEVATAAAKRLAGEL